MASAGPTEKHAATRLPELAGWVEEIAALTKPDAIAGATAPRRNGTG